MEALWKDLRFAGRLLLRSPAFSVTALLALGLGIGSTIAMFTLLDQVVLRPLPYHDPERLVTIWETKTAEGLEHEPISPVNFLDYRGLEQVFEDAAAWWRPELILSDDENQPIRVNAIEVSANFLSVMGSSPAAGQDFPQDEGLFGAERLVLISHRLWRSRYGGNAEVIGKTLQFNDRPYTVVGVMEPGFEFPPGVDVWQRLSWDMARHSRFAHFMEAVGRLRPGISLEQAGRELQGMGARLAAENPDSNSGWSVRLISLQRELVGIFHDGLWILFGAVALLLLLACGNVANLLLARASVRTREVAVRSALGAGRWRLVRQMMAESVLLGLLGSALGLLLAFMGLKVFFAFPLVEIPRIEGVAIDFRIVGFAALAALATSLIFGLVPALRLSRSDLGSMLKEGRTTEEGQGGRRLRNLLAVAEVALSVILLVGSGLLIRSFWELAQEDPGFSPEGLVTANLEVPSPRDQAGWPAVGQLYSQLISNLSVHPQVDRAGAGGFLPLDPGWRIAFLVRGRPAIKTEEEPRAQYVTVTPGYFETLGISLLAGRAFDERDHAQAAPVLMVNQTLASRHWPDGDPIGDTIAIRTRNIGPLGRLLTDQDMSVIGVVADYKNESLQKPTEPAIYFSIQQFPYKNMHLLVRGQGSAGQLSALMEEEVRRLDAGLPLGAVRGLDEVLWQATSSPRFIMLLMCGFATLALILAAIGIYGVLSYTVSRRKHEIGIRMALGAGPQRVRRQVVGQGFLLAAVGALLGTILAFTLTRVLTLSTLLFRVDPADLIAFLGALTVILAASLAACYAPARRASGVDPIQALRVE